MTKKNVVNQPKKVKSTMNQNVKQRPLNLNKSKPVLSNAKSKVPLRGQKQNVVPNTRQNQSSSSRVKPKIVSNIEKVKSTNTKSSNKTQIPQRVPKKFDKTNRQLSRPKTINTKLTKGMSVDSALAPILEEGSDLKTKKMMSLSKSDQDELKRDLVGLLTLTTPKQSRDTEKALLSHSDSWTIVRNLK